MSAIGCEVKFINIIVELVLFKEGLQLFLRGKLDAAWAVDVDVPSACLFTVLPAFQLSNPARGQCFVLELEHFGQMCRTSANFDSIATGIVMVTAAPADSRGS